MLDFWFFRGRVGDSPGERSSSCRLDIAAEWGNTGGDTSGRRHDHRLCWPAVTLQVRTDDWWDQQRTNTPELSTLRCSRSTQRCCWHQLSYTYHNDTAQGTQSSHYFCCVFITSIISLSHPFIVLLLHSLCFHSFPFQCLCHFINCLLS